MYTTQGIVITASTSLPLSLLVLSLSDPMKSIFLLCLLATALGAGGIRHPPDCLSAPPTSATLPLPPPFTTPTAPLPHITTTTTPSTPATRKAIRILDTSDTPPPSPPFTTTTTPLPPTTTTTKTGILDKISKVPKAVWIIAAVIFSFGILGMCLKTCFCSSCCNNSGGSTTGMRRAPGGGGAGGRQGVNLGANGGVELGAGGGNGGGAAGGFELAG